MKTLKIYSACYLIIAIVGLALMASGCSHTTPSTGVPSSYKVKTIITDFPDIGLDNDTTTFTYDALGRVIKVQPYIGGGYEATYRFFGDSMSIAAHDNGSDSARGHLNVDGTLASTVNYSVNCGGCPPENYHILYSYDNAGFITRMEISQGNPARIITNYFRWNDSCLASLSSDSTAANVYSYYANTVEYRDNGQQNLWALQPPSTGLGQYYLFGSILGRHSKHLLKAITGYGNTTNYSYTFDQYGRVATQTTTASYGTTVQQFTYY